jgi:hypothetical protein
MIAQAGSRGVEVLTQLLRCRRGLGLESVLGASSLALLLPGASGTRGGGEALKQR